MSFSAPTHKALAHYVYALVDPRDERIFYVGKASGNSRAFSHLTSLPDEKKKHQRIAAIRAEGLQPRVDILRYSLATAALAHEVEAAVIDTLGVENLCNAVRGHGVERGRQRAADLERLHGAKPVQIQEVREPALVFFLNQSYSPTLSAAQLYDATRAWWPIHEKARTPGAKGALPYPLALAVADSIVVGAYGITAWFPAGSTFNSRLGQTPPDPGKWEFVGRMLAEHPLRGRKLQDARSDLKAVQRGFIYLNKHH